MTVNGKSDRGQSQAGDSVTVSTARIDRTHTGEGVLVPSELLDRPQALRATAQRPEATYGAPMGTHTTANDIVAELRRRLAARLTYLPDRKLHALLYLVQGNWLITNDEPLFNEEIIATEMGVEVPLSPDAVFNGLDDERFALVGTVAARYGGLSAMDLEALIRGQIPWTTTVIGQAVSLKAIRKAFREQDETPEGTLHGIPRSVRTGLHPPFDPDRPHVSKPDSREEIEAFIAEVQARM